MGSREKLLVIGASGLLGSKVMAVNTPLSLQVQQLPNPQTEETRKLNELIQRIDEIVRLLRADLEAIDARIEALE